MPPKKSKGAQDDKKKLKEMTKIAEDKSFGMKNKNKSNKVQKMIKGMATTSIKGGMDGIVNAQFAEKKAKMDAEKERQFLASIKLGDVNAMSEEQKQKEKDPKNTICPYFKAGLCQKGKRCKFSHERGTDNVNTKANLYQDIREEGDDEGIYGDQKKLEEAVLFNEKKYSNPNATSLPCHHFLNAISEKKYGWFWVCPNGHDCKYKHALPPGFVMQSKDAKKLEKIEFNVERDIDEAREALGGAKGTPVTYEKYLEWRDRRKARKAKEAEERRIADIKKAGIKITKQKKIMSGKALFVYDPTLFKDADDAAETKDLKEEGMEEEEIDPELQKGGKKWEAKAKPEEAAKKENESPKKEAPAELTEIKEELQVDEDVFADEEELPDDIE